MQDADGWRLRGRKVMAVGGEAASHFVVTATLDDSLGIFIVPGDAAGLSRRSYSTLRGEGASDIELNCWLNHDALLCCGSGAHAAIEAALRVGAVGMCAEAVGAMERLLEYTIDHVKTRAQFGKPLCDLQVVRHRIAEMSVSLETARATVSLCMVGQFAEQPALRHALVAAATAAASAEYIAEQAVQLHGAMGFTDEIPVGRYFRMLSGFQALIDGGAALAPEYELGMSAAGDAKVSAIVGDSEESLPLLEAHELAFRNEVRAFIRAKLPDTLSRRQRLTTGVYPEPSVSAPWHRCLAEKGWVAPLWPLEFGGTGWPPVYRFIFEAELARAGAPLVYPMGVRLLAPLLIRFGSEAQKRQYLPKILAGNDYWCQGFSEPGAGSDLASLRTSAVPDGDYYVVNGSKLWTTHAHFATHIFMLVRTSREGKRQDGITFLMADLASAGIEIRPIRSMSGEHEVNEIFFDNVRVPKLNRVGEENRGWDYAKYILQFERGAGLFSARLRSNLARLERVLSEAFPSERSAGRAMVRAQKLAELAVLVDAFEAIEFQVQFKLQEGEDTGSFPSILKLMASRLRQKIGRSGFELMGSRAAEWDSEHSNTGEYITVPTNDYLSGRANTIFGGAAEVQLDLIARHALR
jgi:alkylation response protein AidB-like acyl-CoA dehydrogenase